MTTIALNVPRARKDEAKALGARWNGLKKTWYVAAGTDLSPFKALGFYDVDEPVAAQAVDAGESASTNTENWTFLNITRDAFMDLDLAVTETELNDNQERSVYIDAGEHGTFIGEYEIADVWGGAVSYNLLLTQTTLTKDEWSKTVTVSTRRMARKIWVLNEMINCIGFEFLRLITIDFGFAGDAMPD